MLRAVLALAPRRSAFVHRAARPHSVSVALRPTAIAPTLVVVARRASSAPRSPSRGAPAAALLDGLECDDDRAWDDDDDGAGARDDGNNPDDDAAQLRRLEARVRCVCVFTTPPPDAVRVHTPTQRVAPSR